MTVLFISDLHLNPANPEITDCLLQFLVQDAPSADALYVLGDLFEFWIGDDDMTPLHQTVADAFLALNRQGVVIYYIHGNRDFLIGKAFASAAGMILLPEHYVIDLFGTPTLIMHGDTMCIQDKGYQKYRKKVRNPVLQWLYSRLPLAKRRKIGDKIRENSSAKNAQVSACILDVDADEIIRVMTQYGVTQLIHGHTHRPDIHLVPLGSTQGRRIVLGDWYTQGSVLVCNQLECELQTREITTKR